MMSQPPVHDVVRPVVSVRGQGKRPGSVLGACHRADQVRAGRWAVP